MQLKKQIDFDFEYEVSQRKIDQICEHEPIIH